jgi:hypothetical protein
MKRRIHQTVNGGQAVKRIIGEFDLWQFEQAASGG